ncbi:hypothetical protein OPQ81_001057 [Rhizoctonia solani]|nr:hypothetical protein OPQ81_001057 [Rhizoctonia solani]
MKILVALNNGWAVDQIYSTLHRLIEGHPLALTYYVQEAKVVIDPISEAFVVELHSFPFYRCGSVNIGASHVSCKPLIHFSG